MVDATKISMGTDFNSKLREKQPGTDTVSVVELFFSKGLRD
jgi:hypothetical protein